MEHNSKIPNKDFKEMRFIAQGSESRSDLMSSLQKLKYPLSIISMDAWENMDSRADFGKYVDLLYMRRNTRCFGFLKQGDMVFRQCPLLYVLDRNAAYAAEKLLSYCDDFVYWPCSIEELDQRIARLMHNIVPKKSLNLKHFDYKPFLELQLVGKSPAFLRVLQFVRKAAIYDSTVLIEGETGTGKELVARAVHYLGKHSNGPFIPVNCGAVPDDLFENELYGHKKGAYTDADRDQCGLVEQANNGTLFFDEIETLSRKGQIVLLRFLQDMIYKPLGSKAHIKANVRIIAATNQSLFDMVDRGDFRQDLFFRLNVLPVRIPPLRERFEDIELLAQHFLEQFKKHYGQKEKYIHRNALRHMWRYSWPGNVREMENIIHREFILSDGNTIYFNENNFEGSPQQMRKNAVDRCSLVHMNGSLTEIKKRVVAHFERDYLEDLMNKTKGNISKAAIVSGKERRALGKLLKKHGIIRGDYCV